METVVAERFIATKLLADGQLTAIVGQRVYAYLAPAGATFPYVVFQLQAPSQDVRGVGPVRVMSDLLYAVKVIGKDQAFSALEAAANRITSVLHAASGAVTGGTVVACVREYPLSYLEIDSGVIYRHLGGIFRVYAQ